jgi:hypothetical protein
LGSIRIVSGISSSHISSHISSRIKLLFRHWSLSCLPAFLPVRISNSKLMSFRPFHLSVLGIFEDNRIQFQLP